MQKALRTFKLGNKLELANLGSRFIPLLLKFPLPSMGLSVLCNAPLNECTLAKFLPTVIAREMNKDGDGPHFKVILILERIPHSKFRCCTCIAFRFLIGLPGPRYFIRLLSLL